MHKKEERISEINSPDSTLHRGLPANTALLRLFPMHIQPLYKQLGEEETQLSREPEADNACLLTREATSLFVHRQVLSAA